MRIVSYKKTLYLLPWKIPKKRPLYRFILDIPYGLYFSVVPSYLALKEIIARGSAGGGMGDGLLWKPFDFDQNEYNEVLNTWKEFDLRSVLKLKEKDIHDLSFIFDDEIMAIPSHLDYLAKSRQKYKDRFWEKVKAQQGAAANP